MVPATTVIVSEFCLTIIFAVLLATGERRLSRVDKLLWSLLWVTRLLASLGGSRHLERELSAIASYVGLQVCSAIAMLIILARTEALVFKERWGRRLAFQLSRAVPEQHNDGPELQEMSRERRGNLRLGISGEVEIAVLGAEETRLKAQLVDYSGAGMRVRTAQAVLPGGAARIESADCLLSGKIIYCHRDVSDFTVGLQIEQWQSRESQQIAIEDGAHRTRPV